MEASFPDDKDPRHEMLDALTDAVLNEDNEFFDAIIANQEVLGQVEVAEYLNVKRQSAEDPVEQNRWEFGLDRYLSTLSEQEFDEDEVERLKSVVQSMEFDAIVGNDSVAEEAATPPEEELGEEPVDPMSRMEFDAIVGNDSVAEEAATPPEEELGEEPVDPKSWDESAFEPQYTKDDTENMRKLPVFTQAEKLAQEGSFQEAKAVLSKMQGERGKQARKILDWYVFNKAEALAQEASFQGAKAVIGNYASDKEAAANMREALDKAVFAWASVAADDGQFQMATSLITNCASSKARAHAMLEELGLR